MFILIIIALSFLFAIGGLCCNLLLDSKPFPIEIDEKELPTNEDSRIIRTCTVCGDQNCGRERRNCTIVDHSKPCISEKSNQALEEIFNHVIQEYIKKWYDNISDNEDFIIEIKICIQFMMSSLLSRASNVNISKLISHRIIPAIVNHVEICQTIQKSESSSHMSASFSLEDSVLSRMTPHLHITMTTRHNELLYLRSLVSTILPALLHHTAQQSQSVFSLLNELLSSTILLPSLDALANPDNLNKMLILLLRPSQTTVAVASSKKVPMLENYYHEWSDWMRNKPVPKQIEKILQDPQEFYPFLQYMKSIKAVSPINFLTLLDEINKSLLRPTIPHSDCLKIQENLKQLKNLRDVDPELDKLGLSPEFWSVVYNTITGPAEAVQQLCKTEEWLMAYDAACKHLESFYLPDYFESEEYMKLLYGERDPAPAGREISSEKQKDFTLNRIGSKIRHAFSGTMLEGQAMPDIVQGEEAASLYGECLDSDLPPDLSTWRVSIPSLCQPSIEQKKLGQFLYHVQSIRVDQEKVLTTVYRKYSEFYVLEQKLNEFHGNVGLQLSPKKQFTTKNIEFLDSKRSEFESYLKFLLTRPFLKNSELLYNFLTCQTEFNSNILMDLNIGRLMKSVPMKLTKERGQYLEGFLTSFQNSCESTKQVSHSDSAESDHFSPSKRPVNTNSLDVRLHSLLFWNNAGKPISSLTKQQHCTFKYDDVTGYFDVIELLLKHIYDDKPEWLSSVVRSMRPILRRPAETWMNQYVSDKISDVVKDNKMVPILESLKDLIFSSSPPRNDKEKQATKAEAFVSLKDTFPSLLSWWCGEDRFNENLSCIFNIFQQPKWNKQLTYILLDILIESLFPELSENDSD